MYTTQSNICDLYLLFLLAVGHQEELLRRPGLSFKSDPVKVKQEPGTKDEQICSFSGAVNRKTGDGD